MKSKYTENKIMPKISEKYRRLIILLIHIKSLLTFAAAYEDHNG